MNQKILLIVVGILVITVSGSVAANLFFYNMNVQAQNDYTSLSYMYDEIDDERNQLKTEKATLTSERDALNAERNALTMERDALKQTVANLVDERDEARASEEVLQGQVIQMTSDVGAMTSERDALKAEISQLIIERDEARAEADSVRTRVRLVNHRVTDNGLAISFSGYCVNTGIEHVDISFHVTGYDMTNDLVIDLYVQNWTIYSGYEIHYTEVINYYPLVLSSYSVQLLYGDQLTTTE